MVLKKRLASETGLLSGISKRFFESRKPMEFRFGGSAGRVLRCVVILAVLSGAPTLVAQEPTKVALIKTLETVFEHCSKEDYASAAKHFVTPAEFKVELLEPLIQRREISWNGIRRLDAEGKFGKGSDLFEAENLESYSKRAGVAADKLFGFYHTAEGVTAEVLGYWDGVSFKLVRLDDVGKLPRLDKNASGKSAGTPASSETRSDKIARIAASLGPLKEALAANPNDVSTRAKYAQSLFEIGNLPLSWTEMMKAKKLAPESKGLERGMDALINAFTKQGLFGVGVPTETIESLLGEPTKKVEFASRVRYVYGHWAVDLVKGRVFQIIDLRGVTEAHFVPKALIDVDLQGHVCMFRRVTKSGSSNIYFVPGQSFAAYTSQLIVERNPNVGNASLEELGKKVIEDEVKAYQGIKHKVLAQDENGMLIASMLPMADKSKSQHSLTRLMRDERDLHRVTYTLIQKEEPSMEIQKKWFGIFQASSLMSMEDIKKARAAKQAKDSQKAPAKAAK